MKRVVFVAGLLVIFSFFKMTFAISDTTPTYAVTSISVDKNSVVGVDSLVLEYSIKTTNLSGSLGKIGIPRLYKVSVDGSELDGEGNCYNSIPTLISGDISNGSYKVTINFCNQFPTGEYRIAFTGITDITTSPTISYINNAPPPPPPPTFKVTVISLDKNELKGIGSLKIDYTIETTNFAGPMIKIGMPMLFKISGDDFEFADVVSCFSQMPTLISGNIANGNYSYTLNLCNQYPTGEYQVKFIGIQQSVASPIFKYQNDAPPPPPPPTFEVTSIAIDKTSLTGIGSIKLDYSIISTNFKGSLGKIGIPRLIKISGDSLEIDDDANCYNQAPSLISGDVSNGNYTTILNFCNQLPTGNYQISFIGISKTVSSPIINYANSKTHSVPIPMPTSKPQYRVSNTLLFKDSFTLGGNLNLKFELSTDDAYPRKPLCLLDGLINPFEARLISGTSSQGTWFCEAKIPKTSFDSALKVFDLQIVVTYSFLGEKYELRESLDSISSALPSPIPTPNSTASNSALKPSILNFQVVNLSEFTVGTMSKIQVMLSYLPRSFSNKATIKTILTCRPSQSEELRIFEAESESLVKTLNSQINLTLTPYIIPKIPGTYCLDVNLSFIDAPELNQLKQIMMKVQATTPTVSPTPTVSRTGLQNSNPNLILLSKWKLYLVLIEDLVSDYLSLLETRPDKAKQLVPILNKIQSDKRVAETSNLDFLSSGLYEKLYLNYKSAKNLYSKIVTSPRERYTIICVKMSSKNRVLDSKSVTAIYPKCPNGFKLKNN